MLRLVVLVAGLGCAAVIVNGAGGPIRPDGEGDTRAPAISASASPVAQFRLWLAGRKTCCLLSLDIDTGTASAGTCQDGAPNPLLHASAVARHKGGLILTDAAGDAVAEFAVGEGFAYEAVAPAGRLMALSAVD